MTAESERRIIGRWVLAGLPWRTWDAYELTAALYEGLVEDLLAAGERDLLREFLKLAGDTERLGALDRATMGQNGGIEVQDTPPLRGRPRA